MTFVCVCSSCQHQTLTDYEVRNDVLLAVCENRNCEEWHCRLDVLLVPV